MSKKKAVVLLSGGLDSATCLFYAKKNSFNTKCIIFDYGQRHNKEIRSAVKIANKAHCFYEIIKIKLPWKGSALLDRSVSIPKNRSFKKKQDIPATYVPARNTIFLSFALSCAESISAQSIFIGANAIDFSGYPDCRPNYYVQFNRLSKLATKVGQKKNAIKIFTPLINKNKRDIVLLAKRLKVPIELTWSCYKGNKKPCGICDSCILRAKGFRQAGIIDPLSK